jgi:hypothetical protein
MGHTKAFIMAFTFMASVSYAKIPAWAAINSTKLNGSSLRTVCHGTGPSVEIARSEALKSCQINANQFFKSKIKVKSLSVETEKSVGFHQEVSSDDEFSNLICEPTKDELEESDSQYSVWIECKFDLSKASIVHTDKPAVSPNNKDLNGLEAINVKETKDQKTKYIFVSIIPKCESILVKGAFSRVVECSQNPIKIQVKDGDIEFIVRAKGYKPKTIQVGGISANETLQVLLDLL